LKLTQPPIQQQHNKNRTGVVGISMVTINHRVRIGTRRYFSVRCGKSVRRFCLETLGKQEAWRRAVRHRAAYEQSITRQWHSLRAQNHITNPTQIAEQ